MTRQLTTLTLCLLLASCTAHKAEPARPDFDSSRNPDLLSGPVPKRCTAGERARGALRALHPGQHPAGCRSTRPDGPDHRRNHPFEHEPERQGSHAVRDEPLGLLAMPGRRRSCEHPLHPAAAGGSVQTRPDDPAQHPPGPLRPSLAGEGRRSRAAGLLRAAPGLSASAGTEAETGPATVCEARCHNSTSGSAIRAYGKVSTLESPVVVASVPTPAPITTSPAPTKKPESTTVFPSSTGQGWPPLFSSRGFGTDQALGFRR